MVLWWALRSLGVEDGLCVSFRACAPMPEVVCGSMVKTVGCLAWGWVYIRALSLVHCSSSWYFKRFRVGSSLVCRGSSSTLMTLCSSWTHQRSVFPSSRRVKAGNGSEGPHVNTKKTKFLDPVIGLDVLKYLASTNGLSAAVESAAIASSAHSASCWSTRGAASSLVSWAVTQITPVPGVTVRL